MPPTSKHADTKACIHWFEDLGGIFQKERRLSEAPERRSERDAAALRGAIETARAFDLDVFEAEDRLSTLEQEEAPQLSSSYFPADFFVL